MWILGVKGLTCVETTILTLIIIYYRIQLQFTVLSQCELPSLSCIFIDYTLSTQDSIISASKLTRFKRSRNPCEQRLLLSSS